MLAAMLLNSRSERLGAPRRITNHGQAPASTTTTHHRSGRKQELSAVLIRGVWPLPATSAQTQFTRLFPHFRYLSFISIVAPPSLASLNAKRKTQNTIPAPTTSVENARRGKRSSQRKAYKAQHTFLGDRLAVRPASSFVPHQSSPRSHSSRVDSQRRPSKFSS